MSGLTFFSFVIPGEARQRVDPEPSASFTKFWVPDNAFGVSGMTQNWAGIDGDAAP
jgi:hypothetical protein